MPIQEEREPFNHQQHAADVAAEQIAVALEDTGEDAWAATVREGVTRNRWWRSRGDDSPTRWQSTIEPGEVPELWVVQVERHKLVSGLYWVVGSRVYEERHPLHFEPAPMSMNDFLAAYGIAGAFRVPVPGNWRKMCSPEMVELLEEAGLK